MKKMNLFVVCFAIMFMTITSCKKDHLSNDSNAAPPEAGLLSEANYKEKLEAVLKFKIEDRAKLTANATKNPTSSKGTQLNFNTYREAYIYINQLLQPLSIESDLANNTNKEAYYRWYLRNGG